VAVTTAFSRLLHLPGIWVHQVAFETDRVAVTVEGAAGARGRLGERTG
jgi:hypothetical protein